MEQYHSLLRRILGEGDVMFQERTQEYVIGISSHEYRMDLRKRFPLVTTKWVNPRLPFEELFWKLRGERTVKTLNDKKIPFWNGNAFDKYLKDNNLNAEFPKHSPQWADKFNWYINNLTNNPESVGNGDLGPVYGHQWRHWKKSDGEEIDQLANLLKNIKEKPGSRYHILNSWNNGEIGDMALPPCPFWHQFSVFGDNVDLTVVQRSCDTYLGVPFNDAQDALLLKMIAKETGFTSRFFNHQFINTHVYLGVPPRADFWTNPSNVSEFQSRFRGVKESDEYLVLREWYLSKASPESGGNEKKDHIPFILKQLSKNPKNSPSIRIKKDVPLLEAIEMPIEEYVEVENYNPHRWDSKAWMAV